MSDYLTVEGLTSSEKRALLLWRGFAISVASLLTGAVLGAMVGFFIGVTGGILKVEAAKTLLTVRVMRELLGGVVGLWFVWRYICWLFRAQFGPYSLRLVRAASADPLPPNQRLERP